jgi:hypothetical protein
LQFNNRIKNISGVVFIQRKLNPLHGSMDVGIYLPHKENEMSQIHQFRTGFLLTSITIVSIGCSPTTPEATSAVGGYSVLYVATDGNDTNLCTDPAYPCETINGAYEKAASGDWIEIAEGRYRVELPTPIFNTIDKNISLRGAGRDVTILEGAQNNESSIIVASGVKLNLSRLTLVGPSRSDLRDALEIMEGGKAALDNCIIRDSQGGGINSDGTVAIENCTFQENNQNINNQPEGEMEIRQSSITTSDRVAISNWGTMSISDSTIEENYQAAVGSGVSSTTIINEAGEMYIENSQIENNGDVGLWVKAGRVEIHEANIEGHSDKGLWVGEGADLLMFDSQVGGSRTGAIVSSGAYMSVNRGVFSANGHGIDNEGGTILLHASALLQNSYSALSNTGEVTIDLNSLIKGNGYSTTGSAPYTITNHGGDMTINDTTIEDNQNTSGTLYSDSGGSVSLENVIVTSEESKIGLHNLGTMLISKSVIQGGEPAIYNASELADSEISETAIINSTTGFNQNGGNATILNTTISSASDFSLVLAGGHVEMSYSTVVSDNPSSHLYINGGSLTVQNSILVRDCAHDATRGISPETNLGCEGDYLGIGELTEDNGTWVHPLLNDSPAIDAAEGECPSTDQRLAPRPPGGPCDIGAYETMVALMATSMNCDGVRGVSILDNGQMRTNVKVPGALGEYNATLNNFQITCKSYQAYPDILLCDSPKPPGNTYATLTILDEQGQEFCKQTFTVPGQSGGEPDKDKGGGCNLSVAICSNQGLSFDENECECVPIS